MDALLDGKPFRFGAVWAVSNQKQFRGNLFAYPVENLHSVGYALNRTEIRQVHQNSLTVRCIFEATLRSAFGLPVGFSDHSRGIHVAAAAVALGATVIEKHLTLDRSLPRPDHRASIEPDELAAMIASIRDVELAFGDGRKVPAPEEIANRSVARRSLVAIRPIRRGELFSEANLGVKRPGDGIPPIEYWAYLGKKADRDYAANEALEP